MFKGWHIRPSRNARTFVATRMDRGGLTSDELYAGLAMTLVEDTPDKLREALAQQAEIEGTL
ncbi:hypothetical protein [Actinocorallia lasiicapitis]